MTNVLVRFGIPVGIIFVIAVLLVVVFQPVVAPVSFASVSLPMPQATVSPILIGAAGSIAMPPQLPPQCQNHNQSFTDYADAEVRLLRGDARADYVFEVFKKDKVLARFDVDNEVSTSGERLLHLWVDRVAPGGGDGLTTIAMLVFMEKAGPFLLAELGMDAVKILFIDMNLFGWECFHQFHPLDGNKVPVDFGDYIDDIAFIWLKKK
jgi:hypothetical protein